MQIISSQRVARSLLTPEGAEVLTAELDFQLGPRMGIQILGVTGHIIQVNTSLASLPDEISGRNNFQTLHFETGVVENPLNLAAEDAQDIDTEIFWRQDHVQNIIHSSVATEGSALAIETQPNCPVWFPEPMLSARNITHRAEAAVADVDSVMGILLYFKYVEFSLSEMGLLLARRS